MKQAAATGEMFVSSPTAEMMSVKGNKVENGGHKSSGTCQSLRVLHLPMAVTCHQVKTKSIGQQRANLIERHLSQVNGKVLE